MRDEIKISHREMALNLAVAINKKGVDDTVGSMVFEFTEQGSVEKLLSDAEKIYNWLNKLC